MAIANYGELKTRVLDWLSDDSLAADVPNFISMCESRIATELEAVVNQKTIEITIDSDPVPAPVDFEGARSLSINSQDTTRLDYVSPVQFYQRNSPNTATGTPRIFTVESGNFVFSPIPPQGTTFTGQLTYFFRFPTFVNDEDTNDLLVKHEGVYLYGSLLEAAPFLGNDTRSITWAQFFDDIIERLNQAAKRKDFPAGQKQVASADVREPRWRP